MQSNTPAPTVTKRIGEYDPITPEMTRQAEMLYYQLRNQGNRIWDAKRATRPGEGREYLSRQWRKTEHARERAYTRMMRRRAVTGWTYQES